MTAHPIDRDWDRLDALVDEDPIALRDAAWRLTTALAAAEHRATRAEARVKAVRDIHTPEKHSNRDGDGAVCQECLYGDGYSVKCPCPTIRALDS